MRGLPLTWALGETEAFCDGEGATPSLSVTLSVPGNHGKGPILTWLLHGNWWWGFPISYELRKPPGAEKDPSLLEIHNCWEMLGQVPTPQPK